MNKAENDRIHELCALIAMEQDRQKFLALVKELNSIFSAKEQRLPGEKPNDGGEC
jgi:hypothetical protein